MAYKYLNDDGLKAYTKKVKGALKDLHTPIAISSENTTESMAQNVRNIADFVAKEKAAGIVDVNGMAVSCIIDEDYCAVGYLYGEAAFIGITLYDDNRLFYTYIGEDGTYNIDAIILENKSNQITSSMLNEGARKPIILTSETTEVDEETYQKLLSDDVDVVFNIDGNLCVLTYKYKYDNGNTWNFCFTCFSMEGNTMTDLFIYGYSVAIDKNSPHICHITEDMSNDFDSFLNEAGYLCKSTLSPVLQEIDLTGTDAERKAKLDKFEADWKELTGANDLTGARFVGKVQDEYGYEYTGVFVWRPITNSYHAIMSNGSDGGSDSSPMTASVNPSNGDIFIYSLFFHLEPVQLTTATSTNKTQLDLFISKVPNAQVMHCIYKDVYAGTLHKINGSWYGVLVGESNTLAGQLSIKLQSDGTIVEGTA